MADINFIGNTSLGKIQRWTDKKAASMSPISFPGKDAGNTEAIDTLGVIAYINFSGRWTGSFDAIQGYIHNLKSIADGQQISSQSLKSPFVNSRDDTDTRRQGTMGSPDGLGLNELRDSTATFSTNGIQIGDIAKNLTTGETANITNVTATVLTLDDNIFSSAGATYAVTASINVKLLSIDVTWNLPALSICDYQISIILVK
jgi:hypothetical protein